MKRQPFLVLIIMLFAGGIGCRAALGEFIYVADNAKGPDTTALGTLDAGIEIVAFQLMDVPDVPAGNRIAGELGQDTTWSGAYVLEDTVTVPAGVVLNIEPGTVVLMADAVSLVVHGQLLADGNDTEPIRFTRSGDGITWKQITFVEAQDSRLAHCIIEYADSEGAHQDYYEPGPRAYHEAVVVLASHVDFKECVFQKLPDESSDAEGDAIAVISDDPNHAGDASAHIRGCEFLSIGQGVHTRYSYVLVEDCYFTDKRGDNDDVDLWGESTPPPLIRNNVFLNPEHDDMINPTRCSAVIVGNVIAGSDDHGVVLRDRCFPVMMNNLIIDCSSAGIAVENSCEALLVNNTIVDCGRGLRLFDLGRWGPPYRLNPGGGTATLINCIIWNCPRPVTLSDSSNTEIEDRGSHITVEYCDIQGGQDGVSVSGGHSTVTWGQGNINADPQFADPAVSDCHPKSQAGRWDTDSQDWVGDDVTSPCIDAGDPASPIEHEPFPNGGIINMGAYGGSSQASKSYFGVPVCETIVAGDIDGDCKVTFIDFTIMALHWLWNSSNCQFPEFDNDWSLLWRRKVRQIPSPVKIEVGQTGGLGEDLENREWLMVHTQYHQIYFQQSTDANKMTELCYRIDNIYEFLQGRSPAEPELPIKAFIVPDQWGHSRCSMVTPAMRTGDKGDIVFIVTSLLHEETHLFNFAFLEGKAQGWWAGEFFCIYFQTRAELQSRGKNIKDEIAINRLPNGPLYHMGQIGMAGKAAFAEAFATLFFFEQKHGSEVLNRFWRACLESAKETNGGELPEGVFFDVFGKDITSLEKEWLDFYGWASLSDPRLKVEVSFSAETASVQSIAMDIADQAGFGYNWGKSYSQTNPICRNYIWDVHIDNQPLHQALKDILEPQGLTYRIEQGEIVLHLCQPVCQTNIAGDINSDCKIDFADFQIMALHWLEEGATATTEAR